LELFYGFAGGAEEGSLLDLLIPSLGSFFLLFEILLG